MQTKIAIKREQSQARLRYAEREQFGATLKFIFSLAATFITAAVTLGSLTACSSEDLMVADTNNPQAPTYTICIPASMGGDAQTRAVDFSGTDPVTGKPTAISSFKTSDKIYVYNQTKDAMLTGYLTPSADGKTCDLTGTLTGDIAAGDELVLLYNLSDYDSDKTLCNFDYDSQDGTQAGVTDGAMATVTVDSYTGSGVLTTTTTAHFQNVQSMFRFQFTSNGTPVNVKSLAISSKNNALSNFYKPLAAGYKFCTDIPVTLSSATTNPIYVALCIKESVAAGDVLTFEVVDADNKLYTTTKNAPSTGFVNGKYYYNSSAIDLGASVLQLVKPTLSRSDGGKDSELADADALRFFEINSPSLSGAGAGTGINMSISGTSTGYCFVLYSEAGNTINISGLTATYDDENYCIYSFESLTLNISGDNTITCKNYGSCVSALGNLKLSGNGTLTVTTNNDDWCGLYGTNYSPDNNDYDKTAEIDVSTQLAADGYTVTRSARTDNDADNDGNPESYTWTYTVARIPTSMSSLTDDYVAQDGDVLTGTLASNLKLKIAAGATVTLAGMTHHAGDYINSIECLGTANIILAEGTTNDLTRGSSDAYAGLFLNNGITGSTLTISGTGTLLASGGFACAGIGGINYCDDIVINGGTIYATGGQFAPGIGAGGNVGQTGNITINGGNITATGGEGAAGIGAGTNSSYCKDITIENTVTSVTAIKGADANESIGHGFGVSSCGTVKFGTATMFDDSRWTTTPTNGENYGGLHFVISTTTNTNDTWTLTPLNQGQGGLQNYNVNPATEQ